MAGARTSITYDFKELRGALDQLKERSADAEPAWRDIGEYLLNSHRERFLQQVDPESHPWKALNPEYKKRKKKNRDKVLILDGYLRDTLRYRPSSDQVELGTNRIYGATHQLGDEDRGIPARQFLGVSDGDEVEMVSILEDYLTEGL